MKKSKRHRPFIHPDHWLDRWLDCYKPSTRDPKISRIKASMGYLGIKTMRGFFERFSKDPKRYVDQLRRALRENPDKHAPTTKAQMVTDLASLARYLHESHQLKTEEGNLAPMPVIRLRSTAKADVSFYATTLTFEQIARIGRYIESMPSPIRERDRLLFRLFYNQGLRANEVYTLRFCDYIPDPDASRNGLGWLDVLAKGAEDEDRIKIPIHQDTLDAWNAYKSLYFDIVDGRDQAWLCVSNMHLDKAYYSTMKGGEPGPRQKPQHGAPGLTRMDPKTLRTVVERWGEAIGYISIRKDGKRKPLGPHDLRHNAITHLLDRGQRDSEVAAFARHTSEYLLARYDNHRDQRTLKCADALAKSEREYEKEER